MKPISSAIIGVLDQVETRAKSTGLQPGETGSVALRSDEEIRAYLVTHSPAEVDKALQTSLRSSLGVELKVMTRTMFPATGGFYSVADGCEIGGKLENLSAARDRVRAASTPPTTHQAENWLVMLQTATAGARRSEAGQEMALELYSGALRQYPADVAKAAIMEIARTANWFPTLADILKVCDRLATKRQAMLSALDQAIAKGFAA